MLCFLTYLGVVSVNVCETRYISYNLFKNLKIFVVLSHYVMYSIVLLFIFRIDNILILYSIFENFIIFVVVSRYFMYYFEVFISYICSMLIPFSFLSSLDVRVNVCKTVSNYTALEYSLVLLFI